MGSLPAPAVLSTSPQQCLDRLKHTILNVSDAVADIERLDAAPSPDSLTPGETAALVLLRGEMLTAIKERLTDLQEASPSLVRMARGESPSHREVDRAFLTSITEKLDALEQATRTLVGLAAFAATQSARPQREGVAIRSLRLLQRRRGIMLGIPIDQLDFKAFGAKGDGITDDTAAVQAAIDDYIQRHSSAGISSLSEPQEAHLIPAPPS